MSALVKRLPNVTRQYIKNMSTKSVVPPGYREGINPDLTKLKKAQAKFQVDDGVPIFLKGGPSDKVLYYVAWGLTFGCMGNMGYCLYQLYDK